MNSKRGYTQEQYLEANRLHREGFHPVSSKYRRVCAAPALPPDDQLLALLEQLNPREYKFVKRQIQNVIARAIGNREAHLDSGTYLALKAIERECLVGRHPLPRRDPHLRTIEIRSTDRPTVSRVAVGDGDRVLLAVAMEEIAKFDDAPQGARLGLQEALAFLRTRGVEIAVLSPEEERLREKRIFYPEIP